jgi:hypothetical protein
MACSLISEREKNCALDVHFQFGTQHDVQHMKALSDITKLTYKLSITKFSWIHIKLNEFPYMKAKILADKK